ncbi:hypothetical protein [Amycolatopsis nalaikhensis]|uniref:hypothetical protein n=1 Tax=Amycolatopsis nalaikhensis TaxID=715472 RepID=UPI003DA05100
MKRHRLTRSGGTDLDLVLRARGVDSVTLAGVATSAMVAATGSAVHDFFVARVFPSRGFDVAVSTDWH